MAAYVQALPAYGDETLASLALWIYVYEMCGDACLCTLTDMGCVCSLDLMAESEETKEETQKSSRR